MISLRPIVALILAITPFAAHAATAEAQTTPAPAAVAPRHSDAKLKLAEAYLLAGGAKRNHEASYAMMEDAYAAGGDNLPEEQKARMRRIGAKVKAFMEKEFAWEVVKGDYIAAAADTYTEAEMKAAIAFYSTPEGKSLADKQSVFNKASTKVSMKRMQALQPKMTAIMMEEMQSTLGAAVANAATTSDNPGEKPAKPSATTLRLREKMLINDARQIAAAANQFFSENARNETTVGDIRKAGFIARLSGGVKITAFDKSKPGDTKPLDYATGEADAIVLKAGGQFALVHDQLTPADITEGKLAGNAGTDAKAFVFTVDAAEPVKK